MRTTRAATMKASNQGTVNLSQSASGGGGSGTGSGGNSATRQQARGQDICSTVDVRALRVCVYARVGVSECAVWLKRSGTLIPHIRDPRVRWLFTPFDARADIILYPCRSPHGGRLKDPMTWLHAQGPSACSRQGPNGSAQGARKWEG